MPMNVRMYLYPQTILWLRLYINALTMEEHKKPGSLALIAWGWLDGM